MKPSVLSASTVIGDKVVNPQGDDLGKIEELMLDLTTGHVAYAVLSFGGFLGLGDKFFAIPWERLNLDEAEHRFVLNVDKTVLENAPGFDKDHWPSADTAYMTNVYDYYDATPYWTT